MTGAVVDDGRDGDADAPLELVEREARVAAELGGRRHVDEPGAQAVMPPGAGVPHVGSGSAGVAVVAVLARVATLLGHAERRVHEGVAHVAAG